MPSLIDHSSQLHQDFGNFLFNEQLSDLKIIVRKGQGAFDININSIVNMPSKSQAADNQEGVLPPTLAEIPCHKLVLSARCGYFLT